MLHLLLELIGTSSPRLPVTMPRRIPKIGDPPGVLDGKSGWRQRARHRPTTSHSPSWDGERCRVSSNFQQYWNENCWKYIGILEWILEYNGMNIGMNIGIYWNELRFPASQQCHRCFVRAPDFFALKASQDPVHLVPNHHWYLAIIAFSWRFWIFSQNPQTYHGITIHQRLPSSKVT